MFSPTYLSGLVIVLVQVLNYFGIEVASEQLTTTVTTLVTIGAGLLVMYRRYAKGGVDAFGFSK